MQDRGQADTAGKRQVGLVVVHGVGETEPGYGIETLFRTLANIPGYTLDEKVALHRLADGEGQAKSQSNSDTNTFPVVSLEPKYRNEIELTAHELYWADLTKLKPGQINATLGSFRVIFESHHLVDGMMRRGQDKLAKILRALLWLASWMMRGPIAALTIAASAYCMFLLFGPVITLVQPAGPPSQMNWLDLDRCLGDVRHRFAIVQAALFLTSLAGLAWIVRKSDITWYDSLLWLAVVTLGLSGLDRSGLLAEALPHVPGLNFEWADPTDCRQPDTYGACYIGGLYRVIIWGWRLYGIILIIALLALAGRAAMRRGRPWDLSLAPIAASITMVIIQFMMWTTIVVTLLYSMLNRAEVNGDLMGARSGILDILQQKRVDKDSAAFKFFQFPEMKLDWIERFKFVYAMTVLAVILATFVVLLLVRQRRKQARTAGADKQAAARNMPRVLFSPVLMGTLITVFLGLVGLILFQWWFDGFKEFEKARKAFLPFAAVFALILPIIIGNRFSNVVHIARDMIDHQYNLRIESMSWFFPWLFRNQPVLQRRSKIQARLVRVVDSLLKEKKFDDLIFVAHSQGSVIAFDYLRNLKDRESALKGARIQVFTFGSPLGHVFQKYFHEYAPADPMWRSVAGRVDRWINLYRIDDPIGADIQLSAGEAILLRDGGAIENIAMPELGGHQKYWTDMYLAAALHALIVKGSVADTVKAYASEPPRTMPPLWPPPEHAIKAP